MRVQSAENPGAPARAPCNTKAEAGGVPSPPLPIRECRNLGKPAVTVDFARRDATDERAAPGATRGNAIVDRGDRAWQGTAARWRGRRDRNSLRQAGQFGTVGNSRVSADRLLQFGGVLCHLGLKLVYLVGEALVKSSVCSAAISIASFIASPYRGMNCNGNVT